MKRPTLGLLIVGTSIAIVALLVYRMLTGTNPMAGLLAKGPPGVPQALQADPLPGWLTALSTPGVTFQ